MTGNTYSGTTSQDEVPCCIECEMAHGWHRPTCGHRIVGYRNIGEPIRAWEENSMRRDTTGAWVYDGPPGDIRLGEDDDATE